MVLLEEKTQRRNIKAEQGQGRQALGCVELRGEDGEMEVGCNLESTFPYKTPSLWPLE